MLRSSQADDRDRPQGSAAAGKTAEQKAAEQKKLRKMLTKRRARVLRARRGVLRGALQLALLPGMLERELEPGPLRAPCEVAYNNAKPTLRPRNKLPCKLAPNSRKKRKSSKLLTLKA